MTHISNSERVEQTPLQKISSATTESSGSTSLVGVEAVDCSGVPPSRAGLSDMTSSRKEKLSSLIKSAEGGDADAQVALGKMYLRGDGVDKNRSEALRWYKAAARQMDDRALVFMGAYYQFFN